MPQMSPYNWFILFLMFNLIYMYIISNNYFNKINFFNSSKKKFQKKNINLKW